MDTPVLDTPIRLGTRASPLALWQAETTRESLRRAWAQSGIDPAPPITIIEVTTQGDRVRDRPLADLGGKGLFTKDIDQALLDGAIDIAVHSLKDVPSLLPDALTIAGVLPRADPRDVWIAADGAGLADLAPGSVVGTCSPRRQAQVLMARPDLCVAPLRGNVGTRLRRLAEGAFAATLLARAGLDRLGLTPPDGVVMEPETMLPAVGQGAIALVCRSGDARSTALAAGPCCATTFTQITAERAMLRALGGSCHTPIAGLASVDGDRLTLHGLVALPDGSRHVRHAVTGLAGDAARLGESLGAALRRDAGDLLAAMGL